MLTNLLDKYGEGELRKLIKLIRGQAHNRITLFVVAGGVAIISSPWWIEIIQNLLGKELNLPISDTLSKWLGFCLIVVSLMYNYLMSRMLNSTIIEEFNDRYIEHDTKIFNSFSVSQRDIDSILNELIEHERISGEKWNFLINLNEYYNSADNKFLSEELIIKSELFVTQIQYLIESIANSETDKKLKNFYNANSDHSLESTNPDDHFNYVFTNKITLKRTVEHCKNVLNIYIIFRTALKKNALI